MPENKPNIITSLTFSLWANWAVAFGAIALELVFPRLMSKVVLPFPIFVLAFLELIYLRRRQATDFPGSTAMLRVSVLTLFWSAAIMLLINVMNSRMLLDDYIDWSTTNSDIPYITCLIIFPVMVVMSLWTMIGGYGLPQGRQTDIGEAGKAGGVIATLFTREAKYQVQLMLFISVAMCAVEWWYYFTYYINVNMNTPDVFFFNWMPVALYVFSLYLVWNRYRNLAAVIGPIAASTRGKGVLLRFLVLSGDRMLLSLNEYDRWDTPASTFVSKIDASCEANIKQSFKNISGCDDFQLKYLYDTRLSEYTGDVKHYAAFVSEQCYNGSDPMTSWVTLDQIDRLIKSNRLSAELTDEIYRIFTITIDRKSVV